MRVFGGILCSLAGVIVACIVLAMAQAKNEAYGLSTAESIGFGLAAAFGFLLMFAGVRLARWVAVFADLVILVLFVGCVYPVVWSRRGRSMQKTTMANMRSLAIALEARAADTNQYPHVRTIDELAPLLEPTYIKRMPRTDAWGNAWRYESWEDHFAIGSAGRNKKFEKASLRQYSRTAITGFDGDLVYRDGEWISAPDFVQIAATGPKALFDQATSLYRANRFNEAVPLFEQYLRTNPNDALANARIAVCLGELGRLQESIPYLQKAIAGDPSDYQSRSNLGLVYQKLHRPEEGIEWERAAAKIKPNDPAVLNNLGWVLLQAGHNAEAVSVFERAVRLAPNEKLYRENLAKAKKDAALVPPP